MGDNEKPIRVDNTDPDIPDDQEEEEVRDMFRKDKEMWYGKLGDICVTKMRVGVVPGAKPFRSPSYRTGS